MWKILFHLFGALQFSFSIYYDLNYVKVPSEMVPHRPVYGGKFVYLTFWDAVVQSIFFWMCFLNDIFGSNDICARNTSIIRKTKDILFSSIAFPLSGFVAATFWGLYAIDRELVLPKVLDMYFPLWLNHIMHTNIFIFTTVELVTSFREYPSKSKGLFILTFFMLLYLIWTFIIYAKSGHWVYPILQILSWPQRIAFFFSLLLLVQGFYLFGNTLNNLIWNSKRQDSIAPKKKKK